MCKCIVMGGVWTNYCSMGERHKFFYIRTFKKDLFTQRWTRALTWYKDPWMLVRVPNGVLERSNASSTVPPAKCVRPWEKHSLLAQENGEGSQRGLPATGRGTQAPPIVWSS